VFRDAVVAFMDQNHLDAVSYPESRAGAPLIGANQEPYDCNLAPHGGLPALSVPIGFTADGLPVGLELMGRHFDEETLIALAAGTKRIRTTGASLRRLHRSRRGGLRSGSAC